MTTIFISGSREIALIPNEVRVRIDRIIDSGFDIVVGDSDRGVDAAILRYLQSRSYEHVTVYTIHSKPRVKTLLASWRICKIEPTSATKTDKAGNVRNGRELETEKDRAMGNVADFGLVVWQSTYTNRFGNSSVSKGSLRNMHQLLSAGRPVVLYKADADIFSEDSFSCYELRTLSDLRELVIAESDLVGRAYAKIEKDENKVPPALFDTID
jgi:hypothetical protein